ncbi:MAG: AAA family ATPase [Clostridia bacterium]|nr:AAA family ATPase [Clostridia bacterium]
MSNLIAFVGMCGAGKSVATEAFIDAGYSLVYFGGVTMDELKRLGLEKNEANERMVREGLRRDLGPAAFAIKTLPKIEAGLENGNVVIDGLYSWSEYKVLKERFPNMLVVAVLTDREKRYSRLSVREVRPLTAEQAQSRDYAEIENSEKGGPIAIADRYLTNNTTADEFKEKVAALIKELDK